MFSQLLSKRKSSESVQILDDLVRESLVALLPVTALITWSWALVMVFFTRSAEVYGGAVLLLTLLTAWLSYRLHQEHLTLAVWLYLGGLTAAVTVIAAISPNVMGLYLYMQVVLVTITLTSPRATWAVALVCSGLALLIGLNGPAGDWSAVFFPILFILLTATTARLSSQRLFTALDWALSMTREARKSRDEANLHGAELQRVLKSLDEAYVRLERANRALLFAQEAAEKAYRFKAEFVANVSHELRTPLNLIVGFSEMMATAPASYGGVLLPSEYRGDVTAIYRSATHLRHLIDDVLDLSRLEAGGMPLRREPTDLVAVILQAAEMVRGLVEARGLKFEINLPEHMPALVMDRTRIHQVLLNLLTNATRFTDRGEICIRVELEAQEVVITIQDTGRGIHPERLKRAFETFNQMEDGQSTMGSGLGLAVSKRFVELHGGRMWIESQEGQGTQVYFTLPLPAASASVELASVKALPPSPSSSQPVVLVLHDELRVLNLLRRHLEGYDFMQAESPEKAARLAREVLPVAVLADSGELNYRYDPLWADLPPQTVRLVCPLPGQQHMNGLAGALAVLAKPVGREELAEALARLAAPPRTALVIDDDPHLVRLLGRMLRADHPELNVLEAFDGMEGLDIARDRHPDVVLLDLVMPRMTGYEFLDAIVHDETLTSLPVIVLSAPSTEQESAPLPGDFRLQRPDGFSLSELIRLLQANLGVVTANPASAAVPPTTVPD